MVSLKARIEAIERRGNPYPTRFEIYETNLDGTTTHQPAPEGPGPVMVIRITDTCEPPDRT